MKIRIALIILLISVAALACGLFAACGSGHEHNFIILKMGKQKTCTEDGWATYYCTLCGKKKDDIIPAGHTFGEWNEVVKVGCENEGYREHRCLFCALKEGEILPACGHIGEWYTLVEPGCAYTGMEVQDCIVCGGRGERPLSAVPHDYVNGVCKSCGRRDWSVADIHDVDLYNSEYGFRTLANEEMGANMQALYLLIDADARDFHNAQGIYSNHLTAMIGEYDYAALNLTFDQAVAVWKTYTDDHPLYYWLGRTVYYGETLNVPVDDEYITPPMRLQMNEVIYEIANEWREEAEDNAYLAALSFHDKIIYAIDYAYLADGITPQTANWAHNIVGVFTGQGAVCEGYARTFQMLLNMKGIDNVFVTGESKGSSHAWNLAKLDDGEWYWFDLTYDDVPDWMWGVQYNYFAVTDNQDVNWIDGEWVAEEIPFIQNHTPDSGTATDYLYPLPERSETPYKGVGELRLRQTFTIGEFRYAVAGYKVVQLISCTASGDVDIPAFVEYRGTSYEVISVGAMEKNSLFTTSYDQNVFKYGNINRLYFPETIRFIWDSGRPRGIRFGTSMVGEFSTVEEYAVAKDNEYYAAVDGVLFTKTLYTLVAYPGNSQRTEYSIPDRTYLIAFEAFIGVSNLRSLTLGANLVNIGNTNWGRNWLYDEYTGSHNFMANGWQKLTSSQACKALEEIKVSPANNYFSAENGLLYNKNKTTLYTAATMLTEAVVAATVERVEDLAFEYCELLQRVTFEGDALKSMGKNIFNICGNLKEIVFGGTREQWDAIEKDPDWKFSNYVITCLGDL